jgi:hypothetical protein
LKIRIEDIKKFSIQIKIFKILIKVKKLNFPGTENPWVFLYSIKIGWYVLAGMYWLVCIGLYVLAGMQHGTTYINCITYINRPASPDFIAQRMSL